MKENVKDIFSQALEKDSPAAREEYLAKACADDPALRGEVELLLAAHSQAGGFLPHPAVAGAAQKTVLIPPLSEKTGTRIGRYKLLEQIGEGGFGVVWMAEQEEPVRRRVALKIIKLGMDTREVVARFEAERQALAIMDHPNIARVFDGGATGTGRPYFVMELVKGVPVTDYCDANRLATRERLTHKGPLRARCEFIVAAAGAAWHSTAGRRSAGAATRATGAVPPVSGLCWPRMSHEWRKMKRGLTLIELLVVVAIIAVLAALLLPVLSRAKAAARRTTCISNARQINLALRMYADDHKDAIRATSNEADFYVTYKDSIQPYLTRSGSSTNQPLFACPADDFDCDDRAIRDLFLFDPVEGRSFHRQKVTRYSSYFFNGDAADEPERRMAGKPFSSVREPSRVVLAGELSGAFGLSTHDRQEPYQFNNARNVMSFVDGHVSYIRIHWNGVKGFDGISAFYEPPAGYDYKWSGD